MRSENETISAVLQAAENSGDIRAVIRTDLVPVREYLYSYNFCFIVNDTAKYDDDEVFGRCFGERILLFRGDRNYPDMFPDTKAHLMVFSDGITLTVNVMSKEAFLGRYNREKGYGNVWIGDTYKKLLDKDGILPCIERLEETQTLFSETPSEEGFNGACSEFWWVMKTLAEYTLREELLSAMFYLNVAVRDILNLMLRRYIFLREGKPVDMGILDSNMERLLGKELFDMYKKTYPRADYTEIWEAFYAAAELWSRTGKLVAERCGYVYPAETEKAVLTFIGRLRESKNRH